MSEFSGQELANFFHLGVVVDDVPAAMRELEEALGLRWGRITRDTAGGEAVRPDGIFAFSVDGPFHFELLNRQPGTLWAELGVNHVGYWCDDFDAEKARRVAEGWTPLVGPYFSGPNGVTYELVPRAEHEPRLRRYVAGGDYYEGGA